MARCARAGHSSKCALLFPGGIRCQRISCRMNETPLPLIPPCCVRPCERSTRTTWSRSRFPVPLSGDTHRTASKRNPCYGTLLPKLLPHPQCVSALLSLLGPSNPPINFSYSFCSAAVRAIGDFMPLTYSRRPEKKTSSAGMLWQAVNVEIAIATKRMTIFLERCREMIRVHKTRFQLVHRSRETFLLVCYGEYLLL